MACRSIAVSMIFWRWMTFRFLCFSSAHMSGIESRAALLPSHPATSTSRIFESTPCFCDVPCFTSIMSCSAFN